MGTVFPLFTELLYSKLTYHWGGTLFAFIGVAMIPIPYVCLLVVFCMRRSTAS